MPHVIRQGLVDLLRAWREFPRGPIRLGNAVAKVENCFLSAQGKELLLACVVVEYGRPLHPVLLVSHRPDSTAVHLWSVVPVERTEAVKQLVAWVGEQLVGFGGGEVLTTNLTFPPPPPQNSCP